MMFNKVFCKIEMKVVIDVWNVHLNWWEDVAFAFESTRVMPMWRGH